MPGSCHIELRLPEGSHDLVLQTDRLVLGESLNAHLWAPLGFEFSIWLNDSGEPLLDAPCPLAVNSVRAARHRLNPGDVVRPSKGVELTYLGQAKDQQFQFSWLNNLASLPQRRDPATKRGRQVLTWGLPLLLIALISIPFWLPQFGELPQAPHNPEAPPSIGASQHPLERWLATGPLHPAHEKVACASCHIAEHAQVPNQACFQCHTMERHFSREKTGVHPNCVSCHLEHNEPANLINPDNRLCSQCHADLSSVSAVLTPGSEHGLTAFEHFDGQHPEFNRRVTPSPLKFNHQQHLALEQQGDTASLTCNSCHERKAGEPQAIQFDQACASCHKLKATEQEPPWPHGNLAAMVAHAVNLGAAQPQQEALAVINSNLCQNCHSATLKGATLSHLADQGPWQLQRSSLGARFSHKKHEGTLGCQSCHAAASSTQADELLLPERSQCTSCHHRSAAEPLQQCATCHQFHHVPWQ